MKRLPLLFAAATFTGLSALVFTVKNLSDVSAILLVAILTLASFFFGVRLSKRFEAMVLESNRLAKTLEERIRSLETSRRQIESIVQHMAEGVLAIGADSELLLANPAALEILSIETDPVGTLFSSLVRPPEFLELYRQTQTGGRPQSRDVTLYAPTERHLRVQAVSYPMGPSKSGVLMVLHDITDLKRLESLRRDFVANVSHELKTPLTVIRAAVETLLEGALSDPKYGRSFAESISEESERLDRLVEDLLTLARVEQGSATLVRVPIDFPKLIQQEISRHLSTAEERVVDLKTGALDVVHSPSGDPKQISEAFSNLLENAIKYNREGGGVVVRAYEEPPFVCLEVKDTGIGIPPEDIPRIFERFYRVDKARSRETGGTGLG
ncbi:MAG: PAS domain-containing protein, partial [Candidatus Omnitrophica bacterium]|nr:PAS domain-containing protein [Candidatus Omnitrophota bacterium]